MHALKFTTHEMTLLPMHAEKGAFSLTIFNYGAINYAIGYTNVGLFMSLKFNIQFQFIHNAYLYYVV